MKSEDKPARRLRLIRKSIGVRILLTISLILLGIMVFMQFFLKNVISFYVQEYYSNSGALFSALLSDGLKYTETPRDFETTPAVGVFISLCREYNVYSIWMESSEAPYETGTNELYLPVAEELIEAQKTGERQTTFQLGDAEKQIFKGLASNRLYRYTSSHGYDIISYLQGLYDSDGRCIYVVGINFDAGSIHRVIEKDAFRMSIIIILTFTGLIIVLALLLQLSIFRPLQKISNKMRNYASGEKLDDKKLTATGDDELSHMAASYNKMTDEISAYAGKLRELERERLRSEAEISVASQIQTGMLPPGSFRSGPIRIEAVMKPAKVIGGDLYDYITLPDGRIFICIADVSGKGITAALFMAEAINTLRYNAVLYGSPAHTLQAANADLCARNPELLFVTAFAAAYDPAAGTLTYCNAGHNPAYLTGEGTAVPLTGADSLFLGMFPDAEYTECTIPVAPGNTLFLYTDGLPETFNPDRKMFGEGRLLENLNRYASGDAEGSVIEQMLEAAKEFAKGAEAHDDLTILSAHFGRSIILPAETAENRTLREFLLAEEGLSEADKKKICLAAEEIFVNICSYAYNENESGTVKVSALQTEEQFILRFADSGFPYDPLAEQPSPDEYDPDDQIGGLGKLMVFSIMDRCSYEYRNGFNILTLARTIKSNEE